MNYFYFYFYFLFLMPTLIFSHLGCVSQDGIVAYDQKDKRVSLETSNDTRSAMPGALENRKVGSVKSDLTAAVKKNKRDVTSLLNLASVYLAENRLKEAEKYVGQALRVDLQNKKAKKIMAQIYIRRKNFDMATIILNGLGGVRTKDAQVFNMLALIAIEQKRPSDAMAYFRKGLTLDPSNIAIRMNLGVLHVEYRQFPEASKQFEMVLKRMPEHNDAKLHLAIIKTSMGEYEEAQELYTQILSRKKDNSLALYNLAVLKTQKEEFSEAKALLKRYLNTKYAKTSGNDEVYALLDEIDNRQRENNQQVSDEQLRSMAKKVSDSQTEVSKRYEDNSEEKSDDELRALEQNIK